MAGQYLGLSLFIMLLSFFIVLSSMSEFEAIKTQPVMNSLSMTFSRQQVVPELTPPGMAQNAAQSSREGDSLSRLEGLFNATIAGTQARRNRLGTEMQVRMPLSAFKASIDKALRPPSPPVESAAGADRGFLPTLVSLLDTQDNRPYRMDIVLFSPQSPAEMIGADPAAFGHMSGQAADVAARLESAGIPARILSAGLGQGPEGMVDIYFRPYRPFMPMDDNAKGRAAP